ncbi:MAG: hypothetical protein H2040_11335 [Euryhalocaulis sp.]|uniref:hypothetical protein n=1 Tax=Euryhalocaulis sp. TaxID=2744307 RepID=UPI0017E4404E|nr:hypothetical protein [Euryhalocaulis sp.]MBA4802446.1 hypothetical protein [Euryhalocaulis sp.]
MSDSDSRTLVILKEKGSTARLLNLLRFYMRPEGAPEGPPIFRNRLLRRAIVTKHCVAANDRSFADGRRHATKIILPLNAEDLRLGGRYFLLGQDNYAEVRRELWGDAHEDRSHDEEILGLLEGAPSLDPFLLREVFQRSQVRIDPAFLDLSENDQMEMFNFARSELSALAVALFGDAAADTDMQNKLVRKLLFNDETGQIEPLRLALKLDENNYAEGMFAWKGFLYFKWRYSKLVEEAPDVARGLQQVYATGNLDPEEKSAIRETRDNVSRRLAELTAAIPPFLSAYDNALSQLTEGGDASAFRDFLLDSPRIFLALGERMGVLDHIISVWSFMFPAGKKPMMPGSDLMELLAEFETLLTRFKYATPRSIQPVEDPAQPRAATG